MEIESWMNSKNSLQSQAQLITLTVYHHADDKVIAKPIGRPVKHLSYCYNNSHYNRKKVAYFTRKNKGIAICLQEGENGKINPRQSLLCPNMQGFLIYQRSREI